MVERALFIVTAVAGLLMPALGHAQWDWHAADGCLDAARARRLVESTLGGPVADEAIAVSARLEGQPGAWRVALAVTRADGIARVRDLESAEQACAALDDAVVVVAALLIDEVRGLPTPAVLSIEPTRARAAPELGTHEDRPDIAPPTPWNATIRLDAIARIDELPGLNGAPALAIEVTPPGAFAIALSVGVWPPTEALSEMRGGRFYGAFVSLGGCPAATVDPAVELGGCGGLAATYLVADGLGVASPQHADGLIFSIEASFFARVHLAGPLWIRASIGALVPLTRPRATIEVAGLQVLVHEVAPVVPQASFGAELRFP